MFVSTALLEKPICTSLFRCWALEFDFMGICVETPVGPEFRASD